MRARSFPRRVIPIRSPVWARLTSSENFRLASEIPTVFIGIPREVYRFCPESRETSVRRPVDQANHDAHDNPGMAHHWSHKIEAAP